MQRRTAIDHSNEMLTFANSHNQLGGPLEVEITYLKYLTVLRLNDNFFTGTVPTEIGDIIHLEELR